jgi:beta-mannosidase
VDVAWARWGWQGGLSPAERERVSADYVALAHGLLPRLVDSLAGGIAYWPSSPMSGDTVGAHETRPGTSGDNHYWGVWHESRPLEEFEKNVGRFMSEYGFQSFPEMLTVQSYTLPGDRDIDSDVMKAHQRSAIGNRQVLRYMERDYVVPADFEQFLYASQVLQARATRLAFHAHRRRMPYCMGSLVWQLNDCWPVASWSTIDYYHRWKAAHYAARAACKPVIVSPLATDDRVELWVVSDLLRAFPATLRVELKDFSGRTRGKREARYNVKANTSGRAITWSREELLDGADAREVFAVISLLREGVLLDEQYLYFTTLKEARLPVAPRVSVEGFEREGRRYLRVATDALALDVLFYLPDEELHLSDNYINLVPGQPLEVEVIRPTGDFDASRVRFRHVGMSREFMN